MKPLSALKRRIKSSLISYAFLLPVIFGIAIFAIYPIVMSLIYSFSDFNGAFATKVGTFNYAAIFNMGPAGQFGKVFSSFGITAVFVLSSTALGMLLSYMLALFVRRDVKGMRAIRLLCYLPCLIPGFIGGYIWRDIFAYSAMETGNGIINVWLTRIGLPKFTFFADKSTAMVSLLISGLWGIGGGMILWLAAFSNISPELYEAAEIDGAGYMRKLFMITVPLSTPVLFYNATVSVIGGFQIFGTYAAYGAGPEESLFFIAVKIYDTAFNRTDYGLACAVAYLLFFLIALLTALMFKLNGWVHYGDE
jgi:multiple sugar transport system permease protein